MNTLQRTEIDRFLFTGNYDSHFKVWTGDTFVDRAKNGSAALRGVLVSAVQRAGQDVVLAYPENVDLLARAKNEPMVRGLFPQKEQSIILDMLGRSVIFLTPATIVPSLENTPWLTTAWKLTNLYLASFGAKRLSDDAPEIAGLSEATTCYVSMEYFRTQSQFNDYVVHEVAHIFHNCKRKTFGLPSTRHREWLLEIDFAKRETFAYACEAYSRILELGKTRVERDLLLTELAEEPMPPDERVDGAEYVDMLRDAIAARNGWKRILERCSTTKSDRFC